MGDTIRISEFPRLIRSRKRARRSGNYYLYSFDGKLLRQYDVSGVLLKDFIYMGNRLVAEYDLVSDLEIVRESGI